MSEPVISMPMLRSTRPSGRIDTPPIPTRCARLPGRRYCSMELLFADIIKIPPDKGISRTRHTAPRIQDIITAFPIEHKQKLDASPPIFRPMLDLIM